MEEQGFKIWAPLAPGTSYHWLRCTVAPFRQLRLDELNRGPRPQTIMGLMNYRRYILAYSENEIQFDASNSVRVLLGGNNVLNLFFPLFARVT